MLVNRGQVGRAVLTGELPLVVQLAAALSPEVLKAGPADAVRPRPPGVADVQTRFISSVSPQRLVRMRTFCVLMSEYASSAAIRTHSEAPSRRTCLRPGPRGPLDVWPRLLELVDGSDAGVHNLFFF